MRGFIAFVVIGYLIGVVVELSPTDSGQLEHHTVRPDGKRFASAAGRRCLASENIS